MQDDPASAHVTLQAEGVVQPGGEVPLAVASDMIQALSFTLMQPQGLSVFEKVRTDMPASATAPAQSWSQPLLTHTPDSNSAGSAFPAGAQDTQTDALPEAGLWQELDIPTAQGRDLSCMMIAQPGLKQAPLVCLSLVPHAVLHNSLPFSVSLTSPGAEQELHILAGVSQALDWRHLQYRPKKIVLGGTVDPSGVKLQSQAFALDSNHDTQLTLSTAGVAAASAVGSLQGRLVTFHAAVRVQNDPFEVRSGPLGVGGGVTMEVTHITVTPGCFVSNLTHHHLSLQLQGQQPQSALQQLNLTAQPPQSQRQVPPQLLEVTHDYSPWHLECAPSQTSPILNAWRYPSTNPSQRSRPNPLPPTSFLTVTVQLGQPAPSLRASMPDRIPQTPPETGQHTDQAQLLSAADVPTVVPLVLPTSAVPPVDTTNSKAEASFHLATIPLMQPSGRTDHLLADLQAEDGQPTLLTSRCLLHQGRLHLILFTDPQPPCVLHNATSATLLVAFCTLQRDKYGELQEEVSPEVITVAAQGHADCSPRSLLAQKPQGLSLQAQALSDVSLLQCIITSCLHAHSTWACEPCRNCSWCAFGNCTSPSHCCGWAFAGLTTPSCCAMLCYGHPAQFESHARRSQSLLVLAAHHITRTLCYIVPVQPILMHISQKLYS